MFMATAKKVVKKVKEAVKKTAKKKVAPVKKLAFKPCPACHGTGLIDSNTLCPTCGGSGRVPL